MGDTVEGASSCGVHITAPEKSDDKGKLKGATTGRRISLDSLIGSS